MGICSDNIFKSLRKLFSASEMVADELKMKKGGREDKDEKRKQSIVLKVPWQGRTATGVLWRKDKALSWRRNETYKLHFHNCSQVSHSN